MAMLQPFFLSNKHKVFSYTEIHFIPGFSSMENKLEIDGFSLTQLKKVPFYLKYA